MKLKKINMTIVILGILSLMEIIINGVIDGTLVLWILYGLYKSINIEWN